MATRIYKVTYNNNAVLVRASTRSQAVSHVAGKEMAVAVAETVAHGGALVVEKRRALLRKTWRREAC